jgi:ABC-type multidrug transport system ATPase subunit
MKRRLSLVLSTIGDPKVIFMDEPTTGMDPVNRRHVWSFVEKFKRDKVIILVRHVSGSIPRVTKNVQFRPLTPWRKRTFWVIVLP